MSKLTAEEVVATAHTNKRMDMNSTSVGSITQPGLISDTVIAHLGVLFKLVLNPTFAAMGLCANCINVMIFYRMGLSDGVTQNFFILAISDGGFAALSLANSMAYILHSKVYVGLGGPENIAQVVYWSILVAAILPQSVSMVTTVVIAVVRCCCVAMPLKVKFLITARRQLAVILIYSSITAFILIYSFSPARVVLVHNPVTNGSMAMLVHLNWYLYTVFTNISYNIGFIIVIICVIILTISLNRSSKFRETSTRAGPSISDSAESQAKDNKEARIVKTVVFVSIVFILCYLPTMTFSVIGTLVKEFSADGVYRNSNLFNIMFMEMSMLINVSVNIFIYYFFNGRYRFVFKKIFGHEIK